MGSYKIKVIRLDQNPQEKQGTLVEFNGPINRNAVIEKFKLPEDCIIKIFNCDKQHIPWSFIEHCSSSGEEIQMQILKPHQNVKPQISEGQSCSSDVLIRKKVKELEGRVASLESVADPILISEKTDRDLQLLTKQITFLAKRLEEADKAEWIKNKA